MLWRLSHRFDRRVLPLADSHYSRQKPGSPQFVAPGKNIVLRTVRNDALWVSLWQKTEFTDHEWPGAWVCSMFRNCSEHQSSDLIREAVAITRHLWGDNERGMVTFVDPSKVSGFFTRSKDEQGKKIKRLSWGYCFQECGFQEAGWTASFKQVLHLPLVAMPAPIVGAGMSLVLPIYKQAG